MGCLERLGSLLKMRWSASKPQRNIHVLERGIDIATMNRSNSKCRKKYFSAHVFARVAWPLPDSLAVSGLSVYNHFDVLLFPPQTGSTSVHRSSRCRKARFALVAQAPVV